MDISTTCKLTQLGGALLRRQVGDGHVVLERAERRVLAPMRRDLKIRLEAPGRPEGRGMRHEVAAWTETVVTRRGDGVRRRHPWTPSAHKSGSSQAASMARATVRRPAPRLRHSASVSSPIRARRRRGATQTVPERGATTAKALAFASSQTNVSGASMSACTGQASPRACAAARRSAFGGTKPRATHCQ